MTNLERRIIRYKVIAMHMEMVRAGKYETANILYRLLRDGRVTVGLRDSEFEAETALEEAGLRASYDRGYNRAYFRLRTPAELGK